MGRPGTRRRNRPASPNGSDSERALCQEVAWLPEGVLMSQADDMPVFASECRASLRQLHGRGASR